MDFYICQDCYQSKRLVPADMVHHIESLEEAPDKALDIDNLISLCDACHNGKHPEKGSGGKKNAEQPTKRRRAAVYTPAANDPSI